MKDDYPLYVHWYKTLDWILDAVGKFPKSARFSLASRTANIALDVMETVVEAIYTREREQILDLINLRLEKLRVLLRIAYDRKYLAVRQYEFAVGEIETAGKMAGG